MFDNAKFLNVAVFAAGDLVLPSDPGFHPAQPLRDYAEFVRSSLDAIGLRLDNLASGMAHPVRTPDLASRMLDAIFAAPELEGDCGDDQIAVVYRPAAKAGETRICVEASFGYGEVRVTALSVEEALVDLAEEIEVLPPEDDLDLFDDAA